MSKWDSAAASTNAELKHSYAVTAELEQGLASAAIANATQRQPRYAPLALSGNLIRTHASSGYRRQQAINRRFTVAEI